MKKGFLNSGKAKAKLSKDTDLIAGPPKPVRPTEHIGLRYGVVENAGTRPEGYETQKLVHREIDPLAPPEVFEEGTTMYTTQPSVTMDASPAKFPDGWTECLLDPDVKALILATPGFPSPLIRPSSCKYRLSPTPGKGHGLFSTYRIRANDLIICERPLTLVPAWMRISVRFLREMTDQEKAQMQLYEWEQQLKVLFDRLHPDYQAAFVKLANSHQRDGSGPIAGIMRTNGLGVKCLQTGRYPEEEQRKYRKGIYTAVCKEISRLNHSCCPNTTWHFDLPTFSFQLFATRDIAKDEELTISYIGLGEPAKDRQLALEPYGFQCTCPACLAPSFSDVQRASCLSMPVPNIGDGLIKLALIEEAGLQGGNTYSKTLKIVMELCIGAGDAESASTYAKKLANRVWSAEANEARAYTNPTAIHSHPLWIERT
ncbi:hypothetical protein B0H16DRAFT_1554505 [Mycena metata]|uniref:SET domain-containing protein n=1 Tax=Mycena metata TaxID=1033252 RepID=A0AAD7IRK6_9AGAR|nr:hypothetical protein B0H16DRAFT_1554505 [Mycena metata]